MPAPILPILGTLLKSIGGRLLGGQSANILEHTAVRKAGGSRGLFTSLLRGRSRRPGGRSSVLDSPSTDSASTAAGQPNFLQSIISSVVREVSQASAATAASPAALDWLPRPLRAMWPAKMGGLQDQILRSAAEGTLSQSTRSGGGDGDCNIGRQATESGGLIRYQVADFLKKSPGAFVDATAKRTDQDLTERTRLQDEEARLRREHNKPLEQTDDGLKRLLAVFGGVAGAGLAATLDLQRMGSARLAGQQSISEYSDIMTKAMVQLEIDRSNRDIRMAAGTERSTAYLARAENRLEERTALYERLARNGVNYGLGTVQNIASNALDIPHVAIDYGTRAAKSTAQGLQTLGAAISPAITARIEAQLRVIGTAVETIAPAITKLVGLSEKADKDVTDGIKLFIEEQAGKPIGDHKPLKPRKF